MAKRNKYQQKIKDPEGEASKEPNRLNYWRLRVSNLKIAPLIYSRTGKNWSALNKAMGRHHSYLQETLPQSDMPVSTALCLTFVTGINMLTFFLDLLPEELQETTLSLRRLADMEMMTQAYEKLEKEILGLKDTIVRLKERIADLERTIELMAKR